MSLGSMRRRLESGDGCSAKEYRIEDGNVESPRLETFIAGMCGPRTEYVESCREHKSSSSLIPPFEMATLDEMIALMARGDSRHALAS
jgi:hypothetical protein